MPFSIHIGIDYSGAKTANSRLRGLRVCTHDSGKSGLVPPPGSLPQRARNWSRAEVADWLRAQARSGKRFIAGIDHGFSFPKSSFTKCELKTWPEFLVRFDKQWKRHGESRNFDEIRHHFEASSHRGNRRFELRLTEKWTSSAKSVFQFGVQGSVGKSTFCGLPFLKQLRDEFGDGVHFWPFDGWTIPADKSVIAEVYPSIFRNRFELTKPRDQELTMDERDAMAICRWLREMDERNLLKSYFQPPLTGAEREIASLEGWILGVA